MSFTSRRTLHLTSNPIFTAQTHVMDRIERAQLSYDRAKAIVGAYRMCLFYCSNI
jgi:hypothetical protein